MNLADVRKTIPVEPFSETDSGLLYCADCLTILPHIPDNAIDACICDPPYGVGLGKIKSRIGKTGYDSQDDTEEYVKVNVVPMIESCIRKFNRVVLTPGIRCAFHYPIPRDIGGVFCPAGAGLGRWGFTMFHPILYYGKDPHNQTKPNGFRSTDLVEKNGHPCPKPIEWMRWLIDRASLPNDLILDPYCGSGSTLVAAKQLGRRYIGIEISEKYVDICNQRLAQEQLFPPTPPETPKKQAETQSNFDY